MAAWRDRLLPASFRGVPFWVESHDEDGLGREVAVHRYPGLPAPPYIEDIGPSGGVWSLSAFVLGPDYWAARDALRDALRKPGPGELIHPYLGKKTVMVTGGGMSESFDAGGMAQFDLEFSETSEPLNPKSSADTGAAVAAKADAAKAAAAQSFTRRMGVWIKLGTDYVQQAAGVLSGGLVNGALGIARQYLPVGSILGSISALSQVGLSIVSLVHNPAGFAAGYSALLGNFGSIATGIVGGSQDAAAGRVRTASAVAYPAPADARTVTLSAYAALSSAAASPAGNTGLASVAASTYLAPADPAAAVQAAVAGGVAAHLPALRVQMAGGTSISEADARLLAIAAEIDALGRRCALAEEARTVAAMQFSSYSEAVAVRASLADRLDAEAETADDAVSRALRDLRSAVIDDITARAADLRRLISYTPPRTVPAVVIAYQIYGDAAQADDLAARNRVRHPGFVPGDVPLELLSV